MILQLRRNEKKLLLKDTKQIRKFQRNLASLEKHIKKSDIYDVHKTVVSIRDVADNSGETSQKNDERSIELDTQVNKLIREVSKFTV